MPQMNQPAPVVRPLTGGAVFSALSQLVTAATGALTVLVLAKILGPAGTGTYAVALSLLIGLVTFGTLSLQNGISYFVGSGAWPARQALRETQLAALAFGAGAIALGLGFWAVVPQAFRGLNVGLVLLIGLGVPFALAWTFASSVALAVDHYELFAIPPALQSSLGMVVILALGAADGVHGAILGMTISQAATAVLTLWGCLRALPPEGGMQEDGHLRRAMVFGLKSHVANVFAFVIYRLDIFILNGTASARQVGQYSVAVSVTQAIWLLPRALGAVVTPRVARLSAGGAGTDASYQDLVERKGVRHATILAFASGVALAAALFVLVFAFLGPEFHESIELGLILLPGSALLGITGALTAVLLGRGRPEYSLIGALAITPVAVVLYVVLIPGLGAVGAALASSLSYAFGFVVSVLLGRHMLRRPMRELIVPTRSELDDYRSLLGAIRARLRG